MTPTQTISPDAEFRRRGLHSLFPTNGLSHATTRSLAGVVGAVDGVFLANLMPAWGVPTDPPVLTVIAGMVLGAALAIGAHRVAAEARELLYDSAHTNWWQRGSTWIVVMGGTGLIAATFAAAQLRSDESDASFWAVFALQSLFLVLGFLLGWESGDPYKNQDEVTAKVLAEAADSRDDAMDVLAGACAAVIAPLTAALGAIQQGLTEVHESKAIARSVMYRAEGHLRPAAHSLASVDPEADDLRATQLTEGLNGDHIDRTILDKAFEETVGSQIRFLEGARDNVVLPLLVGLGGWGMSDEALELGRQLEALNAELSASQDDPASDESENEPPNVADRGDAGHAATTAADAPHLEHSDQVETGESNADEASGKAA